VLFDAAKHLQRAALTLVNGVIYVAFASHEDTPPITVGYWRTEQLICSRSQPTILPPTAEMVASG
jgi:hypothetical protein